MIKKIVIEMDTDKIDEGIALYTVRQLLTPSEIKDNWVKNIKLEE